MFDGREIVDLFDVFHRKSHLVAMQISRVVFSICGLFVVSIMLSKFAITQTHAHTSNRKSKLIVQIRIEFGLCLLESITQHWTQTFFFLGKRHTSWNKYLTEKFWIILRKIYSFIQSLIYYEAIFELMEQDAIICH